MKQLILVLTVFVLFLFLALALLENHNTMTAANETLARTEYITKIHNKR